MILSQTPEHGKIKMRFTRVEVTVENSSQAESKAIIEQTIAQLQAIAEQIDQESGLQSPQASQLQSLLNQSQAIAASLANVSPVSEEEVKVKSELPPTPKRKLPLQNLIIGAVAALLVGIVIVTTLKFTPTTDKPLTVTIEDNPTPIAQPDIPAPKPKKPQPQPQLPQPTLPPPQLKIQPQEGLIAEIQTEVAEITDQFTEDLINYVEADFLESRLIISIGDEWYQLTPSQQQKMADRILERSQILDFRKLELRDSKEVTLARNPVVGKSMVMLQNSQL